MLLTSKYANHLLLEEVRLQYGNINPDRFLDNEISLIAQLLREKYPSCMFVLFP